MPKGSKVLMADDDAMLLDMYKERLELAGYVVEATPNGEELLARLKEFQPDLIMLDVMMPKLDGYGTLASIKSDPASKDIPVVMLSALMRDFNKEKAMEGGADDYLIKSEAMPSDVITKIEQVLVKYGKGGTQSATIEQSSPETMPEKQEPAVVANHIETQPVSPAEPTPVIEPEVKPVGQSTPVMEPAKSNNSLWIWLTILAIVIIGGIAYWFLR